MSGNRFLLDTNAINLVLLGNKPVEKLMYKASWLGVSVISVIEIYSFPELNSLHKNILKDLFERVNIIDVTYENRELLLLISKIRLQKKLRLPDAIIAASAILSNATLLTSDSSFKRVPNLKAINLKEGY